MTDFLGLLENWFGHEMAELYRERPSRTDGILMCCPLWGKRYVDRFGRYCLPTLLAEQNLAVLRGKCRILLFTDKPSFATLREWVRELERLHIDVQIFEIPQDIMEGITNQSRGDPVGNKYWALGVAGQLGLQHAGRHGLSYHMLMPDHVYAESYFPALQRLSQSHEAIVQPGISASIEIAHEALYAFRQEDGSLQIPDRELGQIGWMNLHKQTEAAVMNKATIPTDLPESHFLLWQARDKLILHNCHMNAAYLSPELCRKAPTRIPATLDAELPAFIGKTPFYVPKANDGLTFIELSDATKGANNKRVDGAGFAYKCWLDVRHSRAWMPYFMEPCEIPIHEQQIYMDEAEIRAQHAQLCVILEAEKAEGAYKFIEGLVYQKVE